MSRSSAPSETPPLCVPLSQVQLALVPPPPAHENLRGAAYYGSEQEA